MKKERRKKTKSRISWQDRSHFSPCSLAETRDWSFVSIRVESTTLRTLLPGTGLELSAKWALLLGHTRRINFKNKDLNGNERGFVMKFFGFQAQPLRGNKQPSPRRVVMDNLLSIAARVSLISFEPAEIINPFLQEKIWSHTSRSSTNTCNQGCQVSMKHCRIRQISLGVMA